MASNTFTHFTGKTKRVQTPKRKRNQSKNEFTRTNTSVHGGEIVDDTGKMAIAAIILSVLSILVNLLASEGFQEFLASLQ